MPPRAEPPVRGVFQHQLQDYICHGGRSSWRTTLLRRPKPFTPERLAESYRQLAAATPESSGNPAAIETFRVPPYRGDHPSVRGMAAFLEANAGSFLRGAVVHGSLATDEAIPYSDFDALVILRDDVARDPAALRRIGPILHEAQKFLFQADPLQHHGWFVLTEGDLDDYNDAHFPRVLFNYSCSLLGAEDLCLQIRPADSSVAARMAFESVARAIQTRLRRGDSLRNAYELKSTLSLFMLLPALYVQVRDQRGIYKKHSFEAARRDFSPEEWACMDQVSAIRAAWHYDLSPWRRACLSRPSRMRRRWVRLLAPAVPADIKVQVTDSLLSDMARLTRLCGERLPPSHGPR